MNWTVEFRLYSKTLSKGSDGFEYGNIEESEPLNRIGQAFEKLLAFAVDILNKTTNFTGFHIPNCGQWDPVIQEIF